MAGRGRGDRRGGDFYNEAEAAYVFNLDPAQGLDFNLSGARPRATRRSSRSASGARRAAADDHGRRRHQHARRPLQGGREARVVRGFRRLDHVALDARERGRAHDHARHRQRGNRRGRRDLPGRALRRRGAGPRQRRLDRLPDRGFDKAGGGVEFWFQPTWDSNDGLRHDIGGSYVDATNQFVLQKLADNTPPLHDRDERRHLGPVRGLGRTTGGAPPTGCTSSSAGTTRSRSRISSSSTSTACSPPAPTPWSTTTRRCSRPPPTSTWQHHQRRRLLRCRHLRRGVQLLALGRRPLDGHPRPRRPHQSPLEFFGSPTNNAILSLSVVNGTRQGEYLYFGADSRSGA